MGAFNCWLELVGGRKNRSFEEQLELERQKRMAMMADMEASETAKRLRMHFARLKGNKYAVFHAICCEARDQKKAQMMNSDKLKKVACYLEMICRGIVQRVFGAMKRYKFMAKQMRDEEERLRALLM